MDILNQEAHGQYIAHMNNSPCIILCYGLQIIVLKYFDFVPYVKYIHVIQ